MRKKILSAVTAAFMLISFASCAPEEPVMPVQQNAETKIEKPSEAENYYGNVNYEFLTEGQLPNGRTSYGTFDKIQDDLTIYLSGMIDKCASSEPEKGSFEDMIKIVYEQCLDTDGREKAGAGPLLEIAGAVENCKTTDELIDVMGTMFNEYGVNTYFSFDIRPDSYDATKNKLYILNINTCGNMKENFTKTDAGIEAVGDLTRNVLTALKVDSLEAKERAVKVVKMLYDIMYVSADYEKQFDIETHYTLKTKDEFSALMSNVNTTKLFKAFQINDIDELVIYDFPQLEKTNEFFTESHLRELKDYALACLFFEYSKVLPPSFSEELSDTEDIAKNKEKKAKEYVASVLEEELGVLYGREICTDEVMSSAEKMLNDIKESQRKLIQNCSRIGEDTKATYLKKLDNMVFLVGYNKEYTSPFTITSTEDGGSFIGNIITVKKGKKQLDMSLLDKAPDRKTWSMSPITVNACYSPYTNSITLPAVMLSKTSFDPAKGEYINLGRLGHVLAHELNHGFDSTGYLYDEIGTYNAELISENDREEYKKLQEKVNNLYDNYKLLDVYAINGKQTLGENIADLGALQCLLGITDKKEEQKQIFEGEAIGWASLNPVKDVIKQIDGDEHSPAEARVNVVLACMDEFYSIYDVKETDKMYISPDNRVKVW